MMSAMILFLLAFVAPPQIHEEWAAWENQQPPRGTKFLVKGKVQCPTGYSPRLIKVISKHKNELVLNLVFEVNGDKIVNGEYSWKEVRFQPIKADDWKTVLIRKPDKKNTTIRIKVKTVQ